MPLVLLMFGAILAIAAFRNTQGNLFTALETDVPGYAKWFGALTAVGGLGFVPGMQVPSRWLLALVLLVLFMANYQAILTGFTNAFSGAGQQAAATPDPATQYAANPRNPQITSASVQGTSGGGGTTQTASAAPNPLDPASYLHSFQTDLASFGFGGIA